MLLFVNLTEEEEPVLPKKRTISALEIDTQIAKISEELQRLQKLKEKITRKTPRAIPYSIEQLVAFIKTNTLPEPLIVGDYIDVSLSFSELTSLSSL